MVVLSDLIIGLMGMKLLFTLEDIKVNFYWEKFFH